MTTKIPWVKNPDGRQGYTLNAISGCLQGCEYCYARKLANGRLRGVYLANNILPGHDEPDHESHHLDPFYPRFWPSKLDGFTTKTPLGIFVCSMGEMFGPWVPAEWQRQIFEMIRGRPQHRFYLLTKQPQNLIKWSPFPDNCWVGVTATDHNMAFNASCNLIPIEAKVKFISFEPLLGHIGPAVLDLLLEQIQWVIIGAQTKPYKPPKIEWVQEIVEACDKAGVAVFLKKNLKPLLATTVNGNDIIESHNLWAFKYFKLRQELPQ